MAEEYYVVFDERIYITREPYEDDSWDQGDTELDVTILGICMYAEGMNVMRLHNDYDLFYGADDLQSGDEVFAVVVRYTTGSTFGSMSAWTICALLKDEVSAYEASWKCYQPADKTGISKAYRAWDGYFEHLDSVTVERFVVQ